MALVPGGDRFTAAERRDIDQTIRKAEELSRCEFSVFVGTAEGDSHAFATRLHNTLAAPARSVLIMVDPTARALEIVTGAHVRRHLSDAETELAAQAMSSDFAQDELVGGLRRGIQMLAAHACG
ncbi:DUF5130 family protein [Nocardioides pacificus]